MNLLRKLACKPILAGAVGLITLVITACGSDGNSTTATTSIVKSSPTITHGSGKAATASASRGSTQVATIVPTQIPPPTPTATAIPALGPEPVTNGSFEEGLRDSWEQYVEDGQVIEVSELIANSGRRSLRIFTALDVSRWPGIDLLDDFPVESGSRYQYGAVSQHSAFGPVQLLFRFVGADGRVFVSNSKSATRAADDGEWFKTESVITAPEGAVRGYLSVQLRIFPDAGNDPIEFLELFVDDVSVRQVLE